ncbi:methyl farnesoate epoxidase-like isoform X2 [Bacillus rossius redtenbacheri]|uniref:methyl farnesoate epoxidase-like isoform X2 n=1 Tax=Bacillus rossius redtenbacheri TaxID=93214 RepID=UPI002FDCD99E
MILTVAVGLCILYIIYSWFTMKPKNFPPGPACLPFIGSVLSLPTKHMHLRMEHWRKEYGPLAGFMIGSNPFVAVCEPSLVLEVLRREEFQSRPDTFILRTRSFNKRLGIFFSDGKFWTEQRRFTLRHLREFGFGKSSEEAIMLDEISHLIKKLESSKIVSISNLFNLPVVNVLWKTLAGTRIAHDDDEFNKLIEIVFEVMRSGNPAGGIINVMPFLRHVFPNIGAYKTSTDAVKDLHHYFKEIISEHEKTLDSDNPRDFIDVYLREKQLQKNVEDTTFTDEALMVTMLDLFFAGVESTANSLSFTLMYMLLHPEVQSKVHEELDRVVGRDRPVCLADKPSLPYVEAVLAETARCNTIAPLAAPHRADRDTHLGGHFIPKDEAHWGDPRSFRPERHLDADGRLRKDDWLLVFGAGKRVCVGESLARNSLFVFFANLAQRFSFQLPPGEPRPSNLALPGFTTAPQPFNLLIRPRE